MSVCKRVKMRDSLREMRIAFVRQNWRGRERERVWKVKGRERERE